MDVLILGCIGAGTLVGVLLFSKVVKYALDSYGEAMHMLILGLTAGSLVSICYFALPGLDTAVHMAASTAMFLAGIGVSYGFTRMGGIGEDAGAARDRSEKKRARGIWDGHSGPEKIMGCLLLLISSTCGAYIKFTGRGDRK